MSLSTSWSTSLSNTFNFRNVFYVNNLFILIGVSTTNTLIFYVSSDNGTTWTNYSNNFTQMVDVFMTNFTIIYGNNLYIIGSYQYDFIYTTPDFTIPNNLTEYDASEMAFGIYSGAYINSQYILLGRTRSFTSYNGVNWTYTLHTSSITPIIFTSIVYYDSNYYYCTSSNNIYISSSVTNTSLTLLLSVSNKTFFSMVYANGIMMAVGDNVIAYTQQNSDPSISSNWTTITTPSAATLVSLTYSNFNNLFVAVSSNNNLIYTSKNGSVWASNSNGLSSNLLSIAYNSTQYGNDILIATNGSTTNGSFKSTVISNISNYTTNWNVSNLTGTNTSSSLYFVGYMNSLFLACGSNNYPSDSSLFSSNDGVSWNDLSSNLSQLNNNVLYNIFYGNGIYVFLLRSSTFYTTTNLTTYTEYTLSTPSRNLYAGCYGNSTYVICGTMVTYTSSNGTSWTRNDLSSDVGNLNCCIFLNDIFYFTSDNGNMYYSSNNGTSLTEITFSNTQPLYSLCYGNNIIIAVGTNVVAYTSLNSNPTVAGNWVITTALNSASFQSITFNSLNNYFFAVDYNNSSSLYYTTENGITWQGINTLTNVTNLYSITYGLNTVVATSTNKTVPIYNNTTSCYGDTALILCLIDGEEIYVSIKNIKVGMLVKIYNDTKNDDTNDKYKKILAIGHKTTRNSLNNNEYNCMYKHKLNDLILSGGHMLLCEKPFIANTECDFYKLNFKIQNMYTSLVCHSELFEKIKNNDIYDIYHFSLGDIHYGVYINDGLLSESTTLDNIKLNFGKSL